MNNATINSSYEEDLKEELERSKRKGRRWGWFFISSSLMFIVIAITLQRPTVFAGIPLKLFAGVTLIKNNK